MTTLLSVLVIGVCDPNDVGSVLFAHGLCVQTAASTREVAQVARETPFAMVFMYLDTPEMLGYVKRLRETAKNRRTPLVGLMDANHKEKYDEIDCLRAGIFDYLTLPLVPNDLDLVLRRWIM